MKNLLPILNDSNNATASVDGFDSLLSGSIDLKDSIVNLPKEYFSYSELSTWLDCAFKHKLKYIEKIDLDGPNEHTEFGQVVHDVCEQFLKAKTLPNLQETEQKLDNMFNNLPNKEKKSLNREEWQDVLKPIFEQFPEFLDKTFPGWEYLEAEYGLLEKMKTENTINPQNKSFKGFVDAIIKLPDGSYRIIDYKTCTTFWRKDKIENIHKQLQLILYKHFVSKKLGIPADKIQCGFLLLRRQGVTKNNQERCRYIPIKINEEVEKQAFGIVQNFLVSLKKKLYAKNRDNCRYCPYYQTKHCP